MTSFKLIIFSVGAANYIALNEFKNSYFREGSLQRRYKLKS